MARLFFLLSGENPTLPVSELIDILEAEAYRYRIIETLPQVLRVESDVGSTKSVLDRSAMTRACCLELFSCVADLQDILGKMQDTSLEGCVHSGESFAVRVRRIQGVTRHLSSLELESRLGKSILQRVEATKVNLKAPQKTFLGVLTEDRFVFGLKVFEVAAKPFLERRPKKRPFFHPSAMSAKMARCMVNLAQPKCGDVVLDPFCGTGGFLVEACLLGCRVIGCDVQPRMIRGSEQNLRHYGGTASGMVVADARHLPLTTADCIVTDPPYGKSATTLGWKTNQVVEKFLVMNGDVIPRGRRICIAAPQFIEIGNIGKEQGFRLVESHFVYVHRSLTREIAVLERS